MASWTHRIALLGLVGCAPSGLPEELGDCEDVPVTTWAEASVVFDAHCTRCHSSELEGTDRAGAPPYIDFDTPEAARSGGFRTWQVTRSGGMPPDLVDPPSDGELEVIWAWLSCDGPS